MRDNKLEQNVIGANYRVGPSVLIIYLLGAILRVGASVF